jgi:hypothetical protein
MADPFAEYSRRFESDGYLILADCLDSADVDQILRIWKADPQLASEVKENANFDGDHGIRTPWYTGPI